MLGKDLVNYMKNNKDVPKNQLYKYFLKVLTNPPMFPKNKFSPPPP